MRLLDAHCASTCGWQAGGKEKQQAGLAARLTGLSTATKTAVPYPEIIATLTQAVLQPDNVAHMADMAWHAHGGPWLQALLKANAGDGCVSNDVQDIATASVADAKGCSA